MVTIVRAVHVQEMRDRITALRVARDLAAFLWTDPVLFATMSVITANHMQELRTALAAVYAEDGDEDPTCTNQVATGAVISALDVNETRAAIVNRE